MQSCSESLLYLLQHNRFMLNPWMITNGSLWHMNGNLTRLPHWAFWAGRFVLQIRPSSPHQIFPKTSANNDKDEMWESWIHKAVLIMLLVQIWEVMIQKQSGELFFGGLKCLLMMKGSSKPFVMSGLLMWLWEGFRLDFELGDRLPLRENETRDQKKKMTKNSIDSDFLPFCLCNRWEGKC